MSMPFRAWHDRTRAQHDEEWNKWMPDGYRTESLTVYGDPADPRYAAVVVLRPTIYAEQYFTALDATSLKQTYDDLLPQGWSPFILSATGPADGALFAAVFYEITPPPITLAGLTEEELAAAIADAFDRDQFLRWAHPYGTPDDVRYTAAFWPNPPNAGLATAWPQLAWNADGRSDDRATLKQRVTAHAQARARPTHIAMDPAQRFISIYADDYVGEWRRRRGLTAAQYQTEVDGAVADGLMPVCVTAQGADDARRFCAIFVPQDSPEPRTFRSQPDAPTDVPAIDEAIEELLKENDARNAALAILDDTRLVYAKGYTWAEPDYPDATPTTYFRLASLTKTITALAVYQLIETVPGFDLDTTLQSVLDLTTPSGDPPKDPRFANITIRHLLEMTSNVNDVWPLQDGAAVGAALPASSAALAAYAASLDFLDPAKDPGDTTNVQYNNTGYMLLGMVVAAMRGLTDLSDFVGAIAPSLFDPLAITRVRRSAALISDQPDDEAVYYPRFVPSGNTPRNSYLRVNGLSVMSPDRPLVPFLYGDLNVEDIGGAGGLSAAIVDYARLIATFNVSGDSPILTAATRGQMLAAADACTNGQPGTPAYTGPDVNNVHGFHGFDQASLLDADKGYYTAGKGGYLWTAQSGYGFTMNGLSFVLFVNANLPNDSGNWYAKVSSAAKAHVAQWSGVDLFPSVYGMPSLAAPAAAKKSGKKHDKKARRRRRVTTTPFFDMSMVRHSMQQAAARCEELRRR